MGKKEKGERGGGGKTDHGDEGKPRGKAKDREESGGNDDTKRDQKLQAILLADSFTRTFRPVTWETPKVLLPLVNVPMLEYTIEFLAQNGVEELFMVCVWHADIIQRYINSSKWPSTITVRCINSASCLSAGDALRELDSLGLIRSDPFILISGDVISNMDLKKAIAFHKEKRKEDNNAVMTVVLKPVQKGAGAKPVVDDLVVALDRNTGQLLLFDDSYRKRKVSIPLEILADHPSMMLHTDFLDCHVDICSPELMLQFSDNFDYQDIRKDFIANEVVNWELGMHLYGYVLQNEYAARVHDPRTYNSICRDIVTRWVYPMVPDAQLLPDGSFTHLGRYVYNEKGVKIDRTADIGEGVVLGRESVIEENVSLRRTIVGRGCRIGAGTSIVESHLWAGVVVEPGASVSQAILCDNVVIKAGACVGRGCIISYGVVIGENVRLPEYSRVSLRRAQASTGAAPAAADAFDTDVLGVDGRGYLWKRGEEGDDDDDEDDETDEDDDEEEEEEDDGESEEGFFSLATSKRKLDLMRAHSLGCKEEELWKIGLWRRRPPVVDFADDDDGESSDGEEDELRNFRQVIADYVLTGHAEGHNAVDVLMEIKGYKFSHNRSYADCLSAVVPEVVALAVNGSAGKQAQTVTALKGLLSAAGWGYILLEALIQKDTDDELVVIETVEAMAVKDDFKSTVRPIFRLVLQILYDSELVSEDALLRWIGLRDDDDDDDERKKLFNEPKVQEFVEWLQEEDEEDDDDDEDDEDED